MLVQLDKPERAGTIDANPAGEIREAGAAQSIVAVSDVEPLALAEPIVEGFARSSSGAGSRRPVHRGPSGRGSAESALPTFG